MWMKSCVLSLILWGFIILGVMALVGCVPIALYQYATHDIECEALQADRDRGEISSTAWQKKCEKQP